MTRVHAFIRKPWIAGVGIVLITFLFYIPALRGGFIWNDEEEGSLTKNIVLEEHGLYRVWFTTESVNYWPITWTSFWIEHRLWGLNPTGYHVVNVLIHAGAAVLLWRILRRLGIPGAWLAALVFAVHPVNVESVAWITQRKNTLSLLFFLVAILCYLRFEDDRRRAWYAFALVAFLLALLSKGAVATLPVVLLLLAWWRRGRIVGRDVWLALPFFAIALLMSGVEIWFQYVKAIGEAAVREDSFAARLAGSGWVVWFYLYKALLPANVCFVYPRWNIDPTNWIVYLPLLALAVTFLFAWWNRGRWGRPVLFALGYYVITLAPVLGFFDIYYMRYSLVADHYQYVSIISVIALVVGVCAGGASHLTKTMRGSSTLVAALLVISLGTATWRNCESYQDEETLWLDTLEKNPRAWLAHSCLGNILIARGEVDAARLHYAEALKETDDAEVHNNYANTLRLKRRAQEAIEHYQLAIAGKPNYADAHDNLGMLLWDLERRDEAIAHFQQAVASRPGFARAHTHLANALAAVNRTAEAIQHYEKALELDPNDATAHRNLATTLASLQRYDEAIPHFKRSIELDPSAGRAYFNLAGVYEQTGDPEAALRMLRECLRLEPTWPEAMERIAWIRATCAEDRIRNATEAVRYAEQAARLNQHTDPRILDTLAAAYAAAGRFDDAVNTAKEAAQRCSSAAQSKLRDDIRARLKLYEQGQAYRAP